MSWIAVGAGARSTTRTWVERESNPRLVGVRIRCKASVCYRPDCGSLSLESNQNLPGFNRARRPHAQERESCRTRVSSTRAASCLHQVPCQAPIIITVQLSEIGRDTQRAPRASMHPLVRRAHPSRTHDLDSRSLVRKIRLCVVFRTPKRLRAARFPRAARSAFNAHRVTCWRGLPRRRPYRRYLRETASFRSPEARTPTCRRGAPDATMDVEQLAGWVGYVVYGSLLDLRWLKRITASN